MSMESFLASPRMKDILMNIIIPKNERQVSYQCIRRTETDFPILSVAIGHRAGEWRIAIGGRPSRAKLAPHAAKILNESCSEEAINNCASKIIEELSFGTNMRASKEYREHLVKILIKKGVVELCK